MAGKWEEMGWSAKESAEEVLFLGEGVKLGVVKKALKEAYLKVEVLRLELKNVVSKKEKIVKELEEVEKKIRKMEGLLLGRTDAEELDKIRGKV